MVRTAIAALLAMILVTGATAARAASTTFGLNGDVGVPVGDFGDFAKLGFGGGVYADYWVKDDYAFGLDIAGSFFSGKDDVVDALKSTSYPDPKVTANVINFGAHGVWAPVIKDSPASPWVTYGVGLYRLGTKIEDADPTDNLDESDNKIGLNGGLGVDLKAGSSMKVGAGVKYHYVFTEDDATSFVTAGLRLTFLTTPQ